ncbi:hypothetical protein Csa_002446 [Cucumis sativus]|nr:hypothetical protein Csa_002446 [Cucumis sativus]
MYSESGLITKMKAKLRAKARVKHITSKIRICDASRYRNIQGFLSRYILNQPEKSLTMMVMILRRMSGSLKN